MKKGNLNTLPWFAKLAIFGGAAVLIYAAFWFFITSGTRAEARTINEQVETLVRQNEGARIASQRLNEFKVAYNAKQQEYDDLKALLPEQREITSILAGLQERARASRLSLRRFSPKDDIQMDFYSGKPVEVEVTSTFNNLREFFDQMAKYQRIVSITDFRITQTFEQTANKSIDAQFLLTAYYVSAEQLQKKAATQQPGQTAPAQAAPAKQ
jgi:Tfp pilus assembly protein PilO